MPIRNRLELASDTGYGDNIEVFFNYRTLTINLENPWAGDSETGFGYTCSIGLGLKKARQLAEWLIDNCDRVENEK